MDFVSRGGKKLEHAINYFSLKVKDKVCADFGCSNGGFTDCMIQFGAKKVYAIDTAYGVLDWKLRKDDRVEVMERTNALHVEIPEKLDFIAIDVSWTKQDLIIPKAVSLLKEKGEIVSLLKPHYEAVEVELEKGKVKEEFLERIVNRVIGDLQVYAEEIDYVESPIKGKKGNNTEYLLYLRSFT